MSVCPVCGKRVKMASGDKKKVQGVWQHKHRKKYQKPKLVRYGDWWVHPRARDQLLAHDRR
jgi:hypothetical protein